MRLHLIRSNYLFLYDFFGVVQDGGVEGGQRVWRAVEKEMEK